MGSRVKQVFEVGGAGTYEAVAAQVCVLLNSGALSNMSVEVHGESIFEPVRQRGKVTHVKKVIAKAKRTRRTKAQMAAARAEEAAEKVA